MQIKFNLIDQSWADVNLFAVREETIADSNVKEKIN